MVLYSISSFENPFMKLKGAIHNPRHIKPQTHQTPNTSNLKHIKPKTHQTSDNEYRAANYKTNKNTFHISIEILFENLKIIWIFTLF